MKIKKIFRNILNRLFLRQFDDIKIQQGQIFEKKCERHNCGFDGKKK